MCAFPYCQFIAINFPNSLFSELISVIFLQSIGIANTLSSIQQVIALKQDFHSSLYIYITDGQMIKLNFSFYIYFDMINYIEVTHMKNKDIVQFLLIFALSIMGISYFFRSNKEVFFILWLAITIILFLAVYFDWKKNKNSK